MLDKSIQVRNKPQSNHKTQPSLFGAQLPLNVRLRQIALEQVENDFWALLEAQTNKASMRKHRQASANFNRDFNRAVQLGMTPADIMASVIGALFEDQALISIYYPSSKKTKKGGK